ncbi:uncharacterized protein CANTADRAFT_335212 [Suhomyces tanzawaensis NRRL Y-17324]|uniref:Uncharacterized protein n=1 Tax=Suhomyces tanzawaensis NRRL Y-17324 TaxID=984487 RepID=A0A1E4SBG2_9ASCO|nr:uncharacterized protein CANTADRAFT_335212 [Suhomyces tanzawaensis NRRL Y-17324]ODV76867.1 hypothetical protein CANTADRAFT_335212 [Suhomyces tanzawaensis NRRL Y-17324]
MNKDSYSPCSGRALPSYSEMASDSPESVDLHFFPDSADAHIAPEVELIGSGLISPDTEKFPILPPKSVVGSRMSDPHSHKSVEGYFLSHNVTSFLECIVPFQSVPSISNESSWADTLLEKKSSPAQINTSKPKKNCYTVKKRPRLSVSHDLDKINGSTKASKRPKTSSSFFGNKIQNAAPFAPRDTVIQYLDYQRSNRIVRKLGSGFEKTKMEKKLQIEPFSNKVYDGNKEKLNQKLNWTVEPYKLNLKRAKPNKSVINWTRKKYPMSKLLETKRGLMEQNQQGAKTTKLMCEAEMISKLAFDIEVPLDFNWAESGARTDAGDDDFFSHFLRMDKIEPLVVESKSSKADRSKGTHAVEKFQYL